MTKKILTIALLSSLTFYACNESKPNESTETTTTATTTDTTEAATADEIVTSTATDKDGKKLEMSFNNTKDIVTLKFNGETIDLVGQKPASGIWYKNDHYELRGKGNDVELVKDGKTVFNYEENAEAEVKDAEATTKSWWVGKHFTNNRPASPNPEEGGADFLNFNDGKTADFKVGDMVQQMTWEANGSSIVLKNKMTNKKMTFKVGNSFLTDEYGTKWTVKK